MDNHLKEKRYHRKKRALRVRKKLRGKNGLPRLSIFRSNRNVFAQIIDDEEGKTLASFSSKAKDFEVNKEETLKETAKRVGLALGKAAKGKKIEKVVFDRGHKKYHGIIAELANGAREAGLKF